jgi:hypothetical protein
MIPVDVAIVIAPEALPNDVTAPIILRDPSLTSLVWLVDTARLLRSRMRLLLALTLGYDAIVVPLCVAGFLAPISAAALSFSLMVVTCLIASRVAAHSQRRFTRDKPIPTRMSTFSLDRRAFQTSGAPRGSAPTDRH